MSISSRFRRVAAIAATALALGLGGLASAAPAHAQTAAPIRTQATVSASSVNPAVYTEYWEFNYTGGYYNPFVTTTSGVVAFALWGGSHFGLGNYVLVEFSNQLTSTLIMQTNGDLELWHNCNGSYHRVWSSGTTGSYAAMQGDGNLVVYNGWASHTSGNPSAYLAIQSDGNLVIYKHGTITPVWASHTNYC